MIVKNSDLIKKLIYELTPDVVYSGKELFELYRNKYIEATEAGKQNLYQLLILNNTEYDDELYSYESFSRTLSRQCTDEHRLIHYCHSYIKPSEHNFYQDTVTFNYGIRFDTVEESLSSTTEALQFNHDMHWRLSVIRRYLQDKQCNDRIGFWGGETALLLLNSKIAVREFLKHETVELFTNRQTAKTVHNLKLSSITNDQNATLRLKLHRPRKDPETQECIKISKSNYLQLQLLELISSTKTEVFRKGDLAEQINIYIYRNHLEFTDYIRLFPPLTIRKIKEFNINIPT